MLPVLKDVEKNTSMKTNARNLKINWNGTPKGEREYIWNEK